MMFTLSLIYYLLYFLDTMFGDDEFIYFDLIADLCLDELYDV